LAKPVNMELLLQVIQQHLQIEWVYAPTVVANSPHAEKRTETPQPAEPLIPPPQEELAKLFKFAKIGDIMAIRKWAKEAEGFDPQYLSFVARIHYLAKTLQINEIRRFVGQYL
jgi:hypothetical protein